MPRTPKPPVLAPADSLLRGWLVQLCLPLVAGLALLGGVFFLGGHVRENLRQDGRHTIAFSDIQCEPPAGLTREEFLEQAQYLANMPDHFNLLDPDIGPRIVEGFAKHPWVAEVQRVDFLPPGEIRVRFVYRQPVLVVERPAGVVDRLGVLLPPSADRHGLPVLRARVAFPKGGQGHAWGDDTVSAAAAVAALLHDHLQTLKLEGCTIDTDRGDVVLKTSTAKVIWGRRPGRERADEASAPCKLQRLLDRPDLAGWEHDLRPAACLQRRVQGP